MNVASRVIPTDAGRKVEILAGVDARNLIVRKTAEEGADASPLLEQARHLHYIHDTHNLRMYPEVIRTFDTGFDMTFVRGETLSSYLDKSSHADDAIANAVDALFDLALTLRKPWHQEAEHRINFLRAEALERRGRFKRAIAKTHLSLKPSTRSLVSLLDQVVADSSNWVSRAIDSQNVDQRARLSIAVHGDFVPSNVILHGPETTFLDVRGVWYQGVPLWDPIMDLASFCVFAESIWPALADSGFATPMRHPFREGEVLTAALKSIALQAWLRNDAHWRARFDVYRGFRVLGNIANHLTTTRQDGFDHAIAVLGPYLSISKRIAAHAT